jgi:hypothetical protein
MAEGRTRRIQVTFNLLSLAVYAGVIVGIAIVFHDALGLGHWLSFFIGVVGATFVLEFLKTKGIFAGSRRDLGPGPPKQRRRSES